MAHIYVKSGGTATGSGGVYSTPKTGSWSTAFTNTNQYYSSIWELMGDYPTPVYALSSGDIIYVSHLHNKSVSGVSGDASVFMPPGCKLLSVDDSNIETLKAGAWENKDEYWIKTYFGNCYIYGMTFFYYESIYICGDPSEGFAIWENCTIGNNVVIGTGNWGIDIYGNSIFINCTFDNYYLELYSGYAQFINCTFKLRTGGSANFVFELQNWNYGNQFGSDIYIVGSDFSLWNKKLFTTSGSTEYPWNFSHVIVDRSTLAATSVQTVVNGSIEKSAGIINCGDSSGNYFAEYYKYGSVVSTTSVYRDGGTKINGATPYSLQMITNTTIIPSGAPNPQSKVLKFKIAEFIYDFSELLNLRIEILQPNSTVTFKKSELWVELLYPDATSSKSNFLSTKEYVLSNSTAYPFSDASWQGLVGPVKQYVSLTTTTEGKEGLCSMYLYCNIPSKTFYVCPKILISKA